MCGRTGASGGSDVTTADPGYRFLKSFSTALYSSSGSLTPAFTSSTIFAVPHLLLRVIKFRDQLEIVTGGRRSFGETAEKGYQANGFYETVFRCGSAARRFTALALDFIGLAPCHGPLMVALVPTCCVERHQDFCGGERFPRRAKRRDRPEHQQLRNDSSGDLFVRHRRIMTKFS
jgi:hypothetical protein